MNTTLTPPSTQEEPRPTTSLPGPSQPDTGSNRPRNPVFQATGVSLLVLGLAHFALIPGAVLGDQRFGWDGQLGNLPLVLTWLVGSLLIAYAVLCYVRAALRPLGLPVGPANWMRPMVKGVVASLITFALMWPGLEPSPFTYAVIPLASAAIFVAWLTHRVSGRGPFAAVETQMGSVSTHRSTMARIVSRIGLGGATFLAVVILGLGSWFFVPAWTPQIVDANGHHVSGSIASLETVRLDGVDQSILIRGWSIHSPVLLVLPGGPGGSYMIEGARLWGDLEKHFTVVQWDPRGVTKSYGAPNPTSRITVRQNVADTIQLSAYLRARFHQQQIYLLGHSGGSIYGIWAVQQRPDLYAAYIGGSQMVNNRLTDQRIYRKLLQHAVQTGDQSLVRTLRKDGLPPYWGPKVLLSDPANIFRVGEGLALKYSGVINEARIVFESPNIKPSPRYAREAEPTMSWTFGPERTLMDSINSFRGLNDVFTVIYPQMQSYDFRRDAPVLKVPVYFMLGQYDVNGTQLSVDYFHKLRAPLKHLYIFQGAGHPEIFQQPETFTKIMVNTVLRETRH